ncbi:unnamed protein product, partial [marine sediment metagenome]
PYPFVDVFLYDSFWYLLDLVTTDVGGFYNFSGLFIGEYILEFYVVDYYSEIESVSILVDGQANYLDVYLDPIPPRSITILAPTDSQTVAGGSVLVSFTASDSFNLNTVEISVNSVYIATTFYEGNDELFVPVFQNGTNVIELYADWGAGSYATDTVTINSVDVTPVFPVKPGDFFHMKGEMIGLTQFIDYNYTFSEWLEPFVMNVSADYRLYDDTGTLDTFEGWLAINVLNGYVPYDDGSG